MIAGYFRVSTGLQEKEKTIETQIAEVNKLAEQNGEEIEVKYIDQNWSGTIPWRPQFTKLREDVKEGKITKVYAYDPDRMGRGQALQLHLIGELEKDGAEIYFVTQPNFTDLPEMARVSIKGINALVSEIERIKIRDRVVSGRLRKANEGHIVTGRPPYGFNYIQGDRKKGIHGYFTHNPNEIRVVKLILDMALNGASDNEIITGLYKKKIKTRNGNEAWAKSTIHKILSTNLSVYTGTWYYKKYRMAIPKNPVKEAKYKRTEKSSRLLNDKSEWIKIELPKELAIITEEQAARIRKLKSKNKAIKKGNIKYEYLLQGRSYCASCSGLNYCDNFHGVPYMRCADKKRSYPYPPKCPGGSIKAEALEKAVWNRLTKLVTNPELIKKEAEKYIERNKQDTVVNPELAELIKRRLSLKKEKEKLSEGYAKGYIDDESMAVQSKRIKDEEVSILQEEKELLQQQEKSKRLDPNSLTENIGRLVKEAKEVLTDTNFQEKRNVLSWLNVRVDYFRHKYSIKGAIPIPTTHSSKLHLINL